MSSQAATLWLTLTQPVHFEAARLPERHPATRQGLRAMFAQQSQYTAHVEHILWTVQQLPARGDVDGPDGSAANWESAKRDVCAALAVLLRVSDRRLSEMLRGMEASE